MKIYILGVVLVFGLAMNVKLDHLALPRMVKRNSLGIIHDILKFVSDSDGVRKLRILYGCNLNPLVGSRYIDILLRADALVLDDELYSVTDKGRHILNELETLIFLRDKYNETLRKVSELING